jgi:hypothetical protein
MDIVEKERITRIIADDWDGIYPIFEVFYIQSIIYSASRCLNAFGRYDALNKTQENAEELVSIVQEAIGHAAALSRYFWPSQQEKKNQPLLKKLKEKRGKKLCRAFGLDEKSPLFNRDMRNAWEHFDERIDEYFLENDVGDFFPSCLLDTHTLADNPLEHIFKLLDVETECLVLMGKKYFFTSLRLEVHRIQTLAKDFDSNGAGLRFNQDRL